MLFPIRGICGGGLRSLVRAAKERNICLNIGIGEIIGTPNCQNPNLTTIKQMDTMPQVRSHLRGTRVAPNSEFDRIPNMFINEEFPNTKNQIAFVNARFPNIEYQIVFIHEIFLNTEY